MAVFRSPIRVVLVLGLLAAGAGQVLATQSGGAPGQGRPPPVAPFAVHPYKSAIAAFANYRSCGIHARRQDLNRLSATLRAAEVRAWARGLGPTLDRLRREYEEFMAVADVVACAGGAITARADARRAVEAFRLWVAAQPG